MSTARSCLLIVALAAAPASSQSPAPTALGTLLNEARAASPRLAELEAQLLAARERVTPAGALANPMLEARLLDIDFPKWTVGQEEMSMLEIGARQTLPARGKREARRDLARAEAASVTAELMAAEREVELAVASSFARLYALDRQARLLDDAHELLDLLATTVAARYAAGGAEQEAVVKAQLLRSRHDLERERVRGERAAAAAELTRLLGREASATIAVTGELPVLPAPADELVEQASTASPELAVRQAMTAAADRMVAAERAELRPDYAVGAGLGLRGSFSPAVILSFGVELPLWKKQRQEPLLRAAEHAVEAARQGERSARLAIAAQVRQLVAEEGRIAAQSRLYDEAIVPQSVAALDAARSAYLAGQGDFSTVIDDFTLWLEARSERFELEAERFTTRAAAAVLVGSLADLVEGARP